MASSLRKKIEQAQKEGATHAYGIGSGFLWRCQMATNIGSRTITNGEEKAFGQYWCDQIVTYVVEEFDFDQLYEESVILKYVSENWSPDDVFSEKELDDWATSNGYEWR